MRPLFFLSVLVLTLFSACDNKPTRKKDIPKSEGNFSPTTNQSERFVDNEKASNAALPDSAITIKFPELSLNIKRLNLFEDSIKTIEAKSDTVTLFIDLGESIEGQLISLNADSLTDLKLEQCYETSVSISNEGPHCDMLQWKHYNSPWKQLPKTDAGQFICLSYSTSENDKFPNVNMEEFRAAVKKYCGKGWADLIKNTKSVKQEPSNIGISRYYLRIACKHRESGKNIMKLIVIEVPMGC